MRSLNVIVVLLLLALPAATSTADPTIESLLSLRAEGMSEGERLQGSLSCLQAGRRAQGEGKLGLALDLYNKCLELNAEEAEAHLWKGRLFGDERVSLRSLAVAELRLYTLANPKDGEALADLGEQYLRLGRIGEAEERFKAAVSLDPGDPVPRARYGVLLIGLTERVQEGVDLEKSAVAALPNDAWFWMSLAWGQAKLQQYPQARATAARALSLLKAQGESQSAINDMNRLLRGIEGK